MLQSTHTFLVLALPPQNHAFNQENPRVIRQTTNCLVQFGQSAVIVESAEVKMRAARQVRLGGIRPQACHSAESSLCRSQAGAGVIAGADIQEVVGVNELAPGIIKQRVTSSCAGQQLNGL